MPPTIPDFSSQLPADVTKPITAGGDGKAGLQPPTPERSKNRRKAVRALARFEAKQARRRKDAREKLPSRPGEFHPEPLTEPDLSLSTYPARATP